MNMLVCAAKLLFKQVTKRTVLLSLPKHLYR